MMTDPEHDEIRTLIEQNIRLQARVVELEAAMREIVVQARIDPELLGSYGINRGVPRSQFVVELVKAYVKKNRTGSQRAGESE